MVWSVQTFRLVSRPAEAGLCCNENGLTLGGAPLLEFRGTGFEPRSPRELQRIFDAAYGHESGVDVESRLRGLRCVAHALDDGALSKAMIASVLLRLPDFDEDGMQRIARAETLSKFNYNQSEPRDWRGRWTTGGNGNPNIVPTQLAAPNLVPPLAAPGFGTPKRPDDDYIFPTESHPSQPANTNTQAGAGAQSDTVNYCPDPGPDVPHGAKENALLYQEQVTQLPRGMAVKWTGVTYDGCRESDGTLLEAKGPNYLWMLLRSEEWFRTKGPYDEIMKQAKVQSDVAGWRLVEWHFAEKPVADYFRREFAAKSLMNIRVVYEPPEFQVSKYFQYIHHRLVVGPQSEWERRFDTLKEYQR